MQGIDNFACVQATTVEKPNLDRRSTACFILFLHLLQASFLVCNIRNWPFAFGVTSEVMELRASLELKGVHRDAIQVGVILLHFHEVSRSKVQS